MTFDGSKNKCYNIFIETKEKEKEMPKNLKACPIYNKDRKHYYECPVPLKNMCHFPHCDLSSDKTCGECVHFEGNLTQDGSRHPDIGHCYWTIGIVRASYKCDCPHHYLRPDNFSWTYSDWIEAQLGEFAGSSSPAVRPLRKKKYQEWKKMFDK